MYLYEKQGDIVNVYDVVPNMEKIKTFKEKEVSVGNTEFYKFSCPLSSEVADKRFFLKPFSNGIRLIRIDDRKMCVKERGKWILDLTKYKPLILKIEDISSKDLISTSYFQIVCDSRSEYGNFELTLIKITKKLYILQTLLCNGLNNNINFLLKDIDISKGELDEVLDCFDFNFLFDIKEQDLDRLNGIKKISNWQEIIDSINLLSKSEKSLARTKKPNGK